MKGPLAVLQTDEGSHGRPRCPRPAIVLLGLAVALLGGGAGVAAEGVSAGLADPELTALHARAEENWQQLNTLLEGLQAAGVAFPGGSPQGLPSAAGSSVAPGGAGQVSADLFERLRRTQSEFQALQQQAFKIGRESKDNAELVKHPEIPEYLTSMREFNAKLELMVKEFEKEYRRATGKKVSKKAKKEKTTSESIEGWYEDIRARVRATLSGDSRAYRAKAMELASVFHERQLQMGDRQRDLQLMMDGPDWPREGWPLTAQDAKRVGDAEQVISGALQGMSGRLDALGGLGRLHESNNEPVLEELAVLNELMASYSEMMEQYTTKVKRLQRKAGKKKKKRAASADAADAARPAAPQDAPSANGAPLRDRLSSFGGTGLSSTLDFGKQGSEGSEDQPFAWLRQPAGGSSGGGPASAAGPGAPQGFRPPDPARLQGGGLSHGAGAYHQLGGLGAVGGGGGGAAALHAKPMLGSFGGGGGGSAQQQLGGLGTMYGSFGGVGGSSSHNQLGGLGTMLGSLGGGGGNLGAGHIRSPEL